MSDKPQAHLHSWREIKPENQPGGDISLGDLLVQKVQETLLKYMNGVTVRRNPHAVEITLQRIGKDRLVESDDDELVVIIGVVPASADVAQDIYDGIKRYGQ